MDYINALNTAYNVGSEVVGDYKRGREIRLLGKYPNSNSVKKLGHYNKQGKRLGIYHA